ncbi:uncharacterized protein N7477_006564 [Penicillium maclennaniae]|uniref:uncharacterized protein n=1 Tax=Penicillium maclennaniae TaxID=1343394 RepID=UPI002540FBB9|nr:uncharacterized protein N7477_006564 [Penicillium maclennaniae]KAJ5667994.1 hypothetical protein N7477_006564 [Penicillium maclennaniae]
MPSIKQLLLPTTLLLATATASTCPKNWLENTPTNGSSKCCYGNMVIDDTTAYCCVYDLTPKATSDSTTTDDYDSWSTAGDCFAKIPFTASDYSQQVSSASEVLATSTIMTNEATTTASSTSTSGSSSTSSSSTSKTSSSANSASTASATNAAMPMATGQEMMLGAAVVVGMFVL